MSRKERAGAEKMVHPAIFYLGGKLDGTVTSLLAENRIWADSRGSRARTAAPGQSIDTSGSDHQIGGKKYREEL